MKKLLLIFVLAIPAYGQMLQSIVNNQSAAVAAGTFTLVQSFPTTVGCSGSTTCSMALPGSLAVGHLVTIQCYTANAVTIQSVNVGGTIVPVYSVGTGNTNSFFPTYGYIVSSTSTAGPVVVTFSSAMGTGSTCYGRELSYSSGTPKLDFARGTLKAGTTSVTGETVSTLTGSNDYMVEANNTDYQITTAVAGTGWANGKFDATNGPGWANKLNSITSTAPTWTISSGSGNAATSAMAHATDATACDDVMYLSFEGISTGTTLTAANLNGATVGYAVTGTNNGWGLSTSPATGITSQSGAQLGPLHTNRRPCGTGNTASGSGSVGYQYDYSNATNKSVNFQWIGSGTKASVGFFIQTSLTTQTNEDVASLMGTAVNSAVAIQFNNGVLRVECFGGSVTTSDAATITAGTKYWATLGIDTAVGGSLAIYETATWTQIGTTATCAAGGWTATPPNTLKLGRVGGNTDTPAATVFIDNAVVLASGPFPVTP